MTAPAPIADLLITPVLLAVRDCFRAELRKTIAGPVCRLEVVHSQALPVMDGCSCECEELDLEVVGGRGDASVRVVRVEPVIGNFVGSSPCPSGWIAYISLVTYRCIPVPEGDEILPDGVLTDTALEMNSDLAAMFRVLGCCTELGDRNLGVEFASPIGPIGGCAGWELQFQISVGAGSGPC